MANRQHIIELNGQKYDALTGQMLSVEHVTSKKTVRSSDGPKHLDGFTRGVRTSAVPPKTTQVHHKPEKSKTLMRSAVRKPQTHKITAKAAARPAAVPESIKKTVFPSFIKPGRAVRAEHIPQSQFVSKFGRQTVAPRTAVVPVKPAPVHAHHPAPANTTSSNEPTDPFQALLNRATSHTQPKPKKTKGHERIAQRLHLSPRSFVAGTSAFVFLVVGGFFAYNQIPALALRIAATRAGVQANLPSYQPAGFSLKGPIAYNPGEISINYQSNSDERNFKVVQRASSWNSETLLDNFVVKSDQPYQTFQAKGRTIYMYNGSNATWVDGGTWYQIEGKSELNSDQLLKIVESL